VNESQELRWRGWLRLELEAVWLYPIIAARFDDLADEATGAYQMHRRRRDDLLAEFDEAEIDPQAPPISYDIGDLRTAEDARGAAVDLERRLCAAIAALAGVVRGAHREQAVSALRASALQSMSWGSAPESFPGLD